MHRNARIIAGQNAVLQKYAKVTNSANENI
jgi:hypothetical protein